MLPGRTFVGISKCRSRPSFPLLLVNLTTRVGRRRRARVISNGELNVAVRCASYAVCRRRYSYAELHRVLRSAGIRSAVLRDRRLVEFSRRTKRRRPDHHVSSAWYDRATYWSRLGRVVAGELERHDRVGLFAVLGACIVRSLFVLTISGAQFPRGADRQGAEF